MAKIMQVINKKSNFQNGTVDLQLYQTGFISLTKLIDTLPGQTVENALVGQKLGFEFFHDLNNKQLATRDYIDRYKPVYNLEIDKKLKIVSNIIKFDYNWKSCVDYKSQIKTGDRADYRLLTKIVAAEKELYDYRFYAGDHIKRNCKIMAAWSRQKLYGSNLNTLRSREVETRGSGDWGWSVHTQPAHSSVSIEYQARDKRRINFIDCQKIPVGTTDTAIIKIGGGTLLECTITKFSLNSTEDDGFFNGKINFRILQGDAIDRFRFEEIIVKLNDIPSPHFSKSQGVYDLDFFKTRVLI